MEGIIFSYRYMLVASCITIAMGVNNTTTVMQDLWHNLFVEQGYSTVIRPVYNEEHVTNVELSLHLRSINSFDEVSGILSTSAYMFISWYDEFLIWNASDYDNISMARWPQDEIWKPDIALYNTVESYKALGHNSMLVENYDDGMIDWAPMEVFQSSCAVDMTYFPYDIQTCELQFMSWSYTDDTVKLHIAWDYIDLDEFTPNPQWEIISTNNSFANNTPGVNVDVISFKLEIQRKPRYHLTSMLLPIILPAILDIFAFTLPSDGGEKSGYAVTVFLAFAVFLTIVSSTMPENSEKLSIFSIYIVIQTAQSTIITMFSLLLIRVASFDETTRIPCVLAAMTRLINCKTTCKKTTTTKITKIGNKEEDEDAGKYVDVCNRESETQTWRQVANAADAFFFILFSLTFAMSTTVCFSVIVRGR